MSQIFLYSRVGSSRKAWLNITTLVIPFFFPPKKGKKKRRMNNKKRDIKSCLSARSHIVNSQRKFYSKKSGLKCFMKAFWKTNNFVFWIFFMKVSLSVHAISYLCYKLVFLFFPTHMWFAVAYVGGDPVWIFEDPPSYM